ncbi:MAG: carboxyl transferase domain-containing protein [Deltaproteobacteria bacterium]
MREIRRLAIVNRGEAAIRCLRSAKALRQREASDLRTIALYTSAERDAPFVRQADIAVELASRATPVASWLDHEVLLEALRASGADAVWPGWGFVAEDAAFVERLEEAGILFLGPSAATMRRLGDKIAAKQLAESVDVPVTQWNGQVLRDADEALLEARQIGFPVVIKASAGGGGRGIRMVHREEDLVAAFRSAGSEASSAFGDGRLFVEACVTGGRHIEVQIIGDTHGNVLALGCRDCSVQRRHQKVLEEAPPPGLAAETIARLEEAAVRLGQAVAYVGVGTVEFLVADGEAFFLEVNPRLQVEHGLTELLTGLDLVELQIRVARGESLAGVQVAARGAAIEARICAEDPAAGFLPAPGRVALFDPPTGPGLRVDSGVVVGSEVSPDFDSLIAKVIAYGPEREAALARLRPALMDFDLVIDGGATNKGFLLQVLDDPEFAAGGVDTGWLERRLARGLEVDPECRRDALVAAAILSYQRSRSLARLNFFGDTSSLDPNRVPRSEGQSVQLSSGGLDYELQVFGTRAWQYRVRLGAGEVAAGLRGVGDHGALLETEGRRRRIVYCVDEAGLRLEVDGIPFTFSWHGAGRVRAATPALVVSVDVAVGDRVEADDALGIVEAMKMEIAFRAPIAGIVREVAVRPGQSIRAGDLLVVLEQAVAGAQAPPQPCVEFPTTSLGKGVSRDEVASMLLGFDMEPARGEELVRWIEPGGSESLPAGEGELASLREELRLYADTEELFLRTPAPGEEAALSNEALLRRYVRRMRSGGEGLDGRFLARIESALALYGVDKYSPGIALERALFRLFAAQRSAALRHRLAQALVRRLEALAGAGLGLRRRDDLADILTRIAAMRGQVPEALADAAIEAHYAIFDEPRLRRRLARPQEDEGDSDAVRTALSRLAAFACERLPAPRGLASVFARDRKNSGDERIFVVAEVRGRRHRTGRLTRLHLAAFQSAFNDATKLLRAVLAERDPQSRLQWNRILLIVEPDIFLVPGVVDELVRRLAPATRRLGLEKVLVQFSRLDPERPEAKGVPTELVVSDLTGNRLEIELRAPSEAALEPQTAYERRVAEARRRNLLPPHEIVRLFGDSFEEYDLDAAAEAPLLRSVVGRAPGEHDAAVVVGVLSSCTEEIPEGMRRVVIVSDPTRGMGALGPAECDRIVAAINLAEREALPVEWLPISAGARIAMESGTENLDATARVVRRIVTFTQAGGTIHIVVNGVNVGAQSYWDALATMLSHCKGILIMTPSGSMVLTGRAALEAAGSVAAEDEIAIGGYERMAGPNGEAQYFARDLAEASRILKAYYRVSYIVPGETRPRPRRSEDPPERNICTTSYAAENGEAFRTIGEIFAEATNPGRKKPFAMRNLMRALIDVDGEPLERWRDWEGAETTIVWDAHLGGRPISLIGIESRNQIRQGYRSLDGPAEWTGGTLFPLSSRKLSRSLNTASGNRPVVVLANLSGFDGSPESMRRLQLEFGAEIARAVVNFAGPILFLVVSRYHGGAYVVFSQELNDSLRASALHGSHASVIGGAAAAQVVFTREVEKRARQAAEVAAAREAHETAPSAQARAALDRALDEARLAARLEVAAEFDAIHSVERARKVHSLTDIVDPTTMRRYLIDLLAQD